MNYVQLDRMQKQLQRQFPDNDVFVGEDENGELKVIVDNDVLELVGVCYEVVICYY